LSIGFLIFAFSGFWSTLPFSTIHLGRQSDEVEEVSELIKEKLLIAPFASLLASS